MPSATRAALLDAAGLGLSGLCLIHCLALPVLVAAAPLAGLLADAEWLHLAFVGLALPVSLAVFAGGARGGRSWPAALLAGFGLSALLAGALGWPAHDWETPLTVLGGLGLAAAHALNWSRRHACAREPHD